MLLHKNAPKFVAPAVIKDKIVDDFSLDQYLDKKYVLLFFYPADFSGLCPTEILAFQERIKEFENLGTQIVGVSTDSKLVHQRWLATPIKDGGIEGVTYPLVADKSMSISMDYKVLAGKFRPKMNSCCKDGDCKDGKCDDKKQMSDSHCGCGCGCDCGCGCGGAMMTHHSHHLTFEGIPMDYRATFLIDKKGIIRHFSINEFAMGRDVEEVLRLVEGIKLIDETGGACPANWKRNKK